MNGLAFYRHKRQYTREKLAALSGITKDTIQKYEKGISRTASIEALLALATALEVTLDALIADYDDAELTTVDRSVRSSKVVSPTNVIYRYKVAKNLRYEELAGILGLAARESARYVCMRKEARRTHVLRLSQYEHMSVDEFLLQYACA